MLQRLVASSNTSAPDSDSPRRTSPHKERVTVSLLRDLTGQFDRVSFELVARDRGP